ncbi:TonB-dependent receptor plug domain-containing protein [Thiolapillus sp.]
MFNKRKTLSAAIHLACTGVVATGIALSGMASAEEEAVKLEKEEVTGSHIKQIDIEGASPIAVISREDIEMSGLSTVADVLRQTPFNTFGSFRELSGTSFQSQAQVDLRGLGAGRTLVLIDGRRLPASPVTGNEAVDLNILPIAAVERIEILKDSASAVYGSEAIGGVVNIILRKDYEGVEISALVERPSLKGADAEGGSFSAGGSYGKGSYIATLEVFHRDIIWSRDRDWSKVDYGDGINLGTTNGISPWGNTIIGPNGYEAMDPCDTSLYAGVYDYKGGTACTYPYAFISAETNDMDRANAFLYLDYEVNNDTTIYAQNIISRVEGFGRYAPAVGGFWVAGDSPFSPYPGTGVVLGHRFQAFGPRDTTAVNWQWDTILGLKGVFSEIDYDVFVRYNQYESDFTGENYIYDSIAAEQVALGNYNPFDPFSQDPAHLAAMDLMRATIGRDIENSYFNAGFNLTGDTPWELQGGNIAWAAGYEYRSEDFSDIYDAASQAGNIIGSSGASSKGTRDQWAVYAEVNIPILDNLELTGALRHDSYDDIGSATSPQIKLRWQAMDNLMVRASWGQGFRAPSMSDMYTAPAFSADFVRDYTYCEANGIPSDQCPEYQEDTYYGGNPDLKPEDSQSFNLGIFWEPIDNLNVEVDVYDISIDDVVQTYSAQALVNLERDGLGLPADTAIHRRADGSIDYIDTITSNVASRQVRGIDFTIDYDWDLGGWGSLKPRLTWVHILDYNYQAAPETDEFDISGQWAQPDDRAQLQLVWDYEGFRTAWIVDYIDSMDATPNDIDSYTQHTVSITYNASWDGVFTFGARNLFEEEPPIDTTVDTDREFYAMYPIDGRVWFLNYTQKF